MSNFVFTAVGVVCQSRHYVKGSRTAGIIPLKIESGSVVSISGVERLIEVFYLSDFLP